MGRQIQRINPAEVERLFWKLSKDDNHTVNGIYGHLLRRGKVGSDEVRDKISIVKALKRRELEPFQGEDQPVDGVTTQIILRLEKELGIGSNAIGKFMSIPPYAAGKVLDKRNNEKSRMKYEQLVEAREREAAGK
ncbi:MAG: hypothetical protein KGH78_02315 [Candidatus Micrarchaeota archaeon]|nr:hypothetical protein [Candidatus Micrarchaeota archaeon]